MRDFKILEKYPKTEEGEKALVEALQSAESDRAAKRLVGNWIRDNRRCPMPCDIYSTLKTSGKLPLTRREFAPVPKGEDIPLPEYYCNQCEDTGWYLVNLQQRIKETGEPYTEAKRCSHPLESQGTRRK